MKKEDLRAKKTKKAIKNAFITLVKERGYSQITVSDIADRAEINRNTFYLHYESKDDLVNSLFLEVLNIQKLQMLIVSNRLKLDKAHIRKIYLFISLKALLNLLLEELDFYRVIINDEDLSIYILKINSLIKKEMTTLFNANNVTNEVMIEFVMSGVVGVIKDWLQKQNPEETIIETADSLSCYIYYCFKETLKRDGFNVKTTH